MDTNINVLAQQHYQNGMKALSEGSLENAKYDFQQGLEANPEYADLYQGMGLVQTMLHNDLKKAIECFDKAIELDPASVSAYLERGRVYTLLWLDYHAYDDFGMALQLSERTNPLVFDYCAVLCLKNQKIQDALHNCEDAMNTGTPTALTYLNIGMTYLMEEKYSLAWKYIKEVEAKGIFKNLSEAVQAYNNLGLVKYHQGDYQSGFIQCKIAIEAHPNDVEAYLILAGCAICMDKLSEAWSLVNSVEIPVNWVLENWLLSYIQLVVAKLNFDDQDQIAPLEAIFTEQFDAFHQAKVNRSPPGKLLMINHRISLWSPDVLLDAVNAQDTIEVATKEYIERHTRLLQSHIYADR